MLGDIIILNGKLFELWVYQKIEKLNKKEKPWRKQKIINRRIGKWSIFMNKLFAGEFDFLK